MAERIASQTHPEDIADGCQEAVLELGIRNRQVPQRAPLAPTFFEEFPFSLSSGDDEGVCVDREPDRRPVLQPHILAAQKNLQAGGKKDLADEQRREVIDGLAAGILLGFICRQRVATQSGAGIEDEAFQFRAHRPLLCTCPRQASTEQKHVVLECAPTGGQGPCRSDVNAAAR